MLQIQNLSKETVMETDLGSGVGVNSPEGVCWPTVRPHQFCYQSLAKATKSVCPNIGEKNVEWMLKSNVKMVSITPSSYTQK